MTRPISSFSSRELGLRQVLSGFVAGFAVGCCRLLTVAAHGTRIIKRNVGPCRFLSPR
jgi:hypothetical protein